MAVILVTSVGSGVGQAVVAALRAAGRQRIVGVNAEPFAAGNFQCDACHLVPPVDDDPTSYERALAAVIARERPAMVIPGHDRELPVLARMESRLRDCHGTFVLVSGVEATAVCNDKYRAATAVSGAGIPFAPTARQPAEIEALVRTCGFPLIVKPAEGYASRSVRVVNGPAAMDEACSATDSPVVQDFLVPARAARSKQALDCVAGGEGPSPCPQDEEYSAQALVANDGGVMGFFASRHGLMHGIPLHIEQVDEPALEGLVRRVVDALVPLGLRGPLNLQAIRTADGTFVPFELNARFTGISSTRAAMGFNECEAAVRHYAEAGDGRECLAFTPGLCAVRYLTDQLVSAEAIDRFRREGQWPGSS